ncbi:MAG TPA: class I SAM-dependent methyltransferase [Gemmatimonadaceae bacterium]|nr:class I SAM-dependent methyltransferase [Gemmatimonadaceae bacterium]
MTVSPPAGNARPEEPLDWFEESFGEDYLSLYPHRDETEAERVIDLIAERVAGVRVQRALDLACGAGRHSRLLGERWWTVGLDLSRVLLRVARKGSPADPFVRADMRLLPFRERAFDLVVNLFTSFGYFGDDEEHLRVMHEVAAVIRPGGMFVIDFLNAQQVRSNLVPRDEKSMNGLLVEQLRSISDDGRYVEKTIRLAAKGKQFLERVRLFSPTDLEAMLGAAGFTVQERAGNYDGSPWSAEAPRIILFAVRS